MSDIVIKVENLSKQYLVGHQSASREPYTALRDLLGREARNFARKAGDLLAGRQIVQGDEVEEFWALKDVSFEVKRGEVLGIIGRNGAGKSTLLKILSRITEPTTGRVRLRGRVSSLLEVGTGFHPELTGRENIYLNGAILGMTRAEIRRKFDEIVAFADVEKFLDTPVKRFSSGMYVRLAFAVAAHLEPEILVVDEVLAVGDAEFQKKCIGKMQDVATNQGRTILFVSHNIGAISSLCTQGLFLRSGCVGVFGDAQAAIHSYMTDHARQGFAVRFADNDPSAGDEVVRVRGAQIRGPSGELQGNISVGDSAWIEVDYEVQRRSPSPRINLHFCTEDGAYAFASIENTPGGRGPGKYRCRMRLPANFLNAKKYIITIYVTSFGPTHVHALLRDVLMLDVVDELDAVTRQTYEGFFPGALRPVMDWEVQTAETSEPATLSSCA
jgi:lipopolysaccharide transport system ATP-binding protein